MKNYAFEGAGVFCNDYVMIVRIGIGDAAAGWGYVVYSTFVERLEKGGQRARPRHLLQVDQLLAATKLTGSDVFLHVRDHHRNDSKRLGHTRGFGYHSDFHDLRFNLPEACLQGLLTGT